MLAPLLSEQYSSLDSSPRTNKDQEPECGLLCSWLSSHSLFLLSGISSTSNGYTSMTSSLLVLMLLDTPCKLRKHSWYGAYSSVLSSTSPGHISFASPLPMLLARTESKSQSTGLVELAIWFQIWVWKVKKSPKRRKKSQRKISQLRLMPRPRSQLREMHERPNDLRDQSLYSTFRNLSFQNSCI